jgi:hypothetical protein
MNNTATLTWTNPTTRTDGSILSSSDIATVSIFDVSTASPSLDLIKTITGGTTTTFTTDALTTGFHNFTVTVTDTVGHTSAQSNVASVEVISTLANPSPATNLTAVLNA